jgi:HAD superfamily hydrolase (TIGR01509 family)
VSSANAFPRGRRWNAVLFDMDGVLIETFDAWCAVMEGCRSSRGLPPLGREAIRRTWGQGILVDCRSFFPSTSPRELAREYARGFREHADKVRVEPGAAAALDALAARDLPRAVVTNSPRRLTEEVLRAVGLWERFDAAATGDEVRHGKPDPEIISLALERLGVAPGDGVVMIGDTGNDAEAARRARIPFVGYRIPGDATIERLEQLQEALGL